MRCQNCAIDGLSGKYCGKCGKHLTEHLCTNCGTEVEGKSFCGKCGVKTQQSQPTKTKSPSGKSRTVKSIGIWVALVMVAVIGLFISINVAQQRAGEVQASAAASAEASASASAAQAQQEQAAADAKRRKEAAARKAAADAAAAAEADAGTADGPISGSNSQTFPTVEVPDFVGYTEQQAIHLGMDNGLVIATRYTTYDTLTSCRALQTGLVVAQDRAPRTVVSTDHRLPESTIWITVDCSR